MNVENLPRYLVSLSISLRLVAKMDSAYDDKLRELAKGVMSEIAGRQDVMDSLIQDSKMAIPGMSMRQVDIKNDDESVLFKTFTFWYEPQKAWIILVESGSENYWEEQHKPIGKG